MARKGRIDRGILTKVLSDGTLAYYARWYYQGKEYRRGMFFSKELAKQFYQGVKDQLRAHTYRQETL